MASCLGAMLGSCAATTFCCVAKAGEFQNWQSGKVATFVLQVYSVLWMLIVRATLTNSNQWLDSSVFSSGIEKCTDDDQSTLCYKQQAVYRLGTGAVIVFLLHLLGLVCGSRQALSILNSFWIGKLLAVPLLGFVFLWVPNGFFDTMVKIYQVVLAIFLVLQMVALLDFGYSWNELWVGNALEDQAAERTNEYAGRKWYGGIYAVSGVFVITSIVCYGVMWNVNDGNGVHNSVSGIIWLFIASLVVSALLILLSITEWAKHGALLPSCVVMLYVVWLNWSAAQSNINWGPSVSTGRLVIGLLVAALSLFYVALSTRTVPMEPVHTKEGAADAETPAETSSGAERQPSEVEGPVPAWSMIAYFNVLNLSANCYFVVLSSVWMDRPDTYSDGSWDELSWWVQVSAIIAMLLLYCWTLVAPILMPGRFE